MASSPYRTALETLRRCQQGLAADATAEERNRLLALHESALRVLENAGQYRLSTQVLIVRIARLQLQLADRSPSERAVAICERLGLSRSRFYELRKISEKSGINPDSFLMQ
jgi:hypothetical protein